MDLKAGSQLGPYQIVSPIGAGGMGEVWRARDTRLEREVAIKVLPGDFAGNAGMRVRFEREAKTISQLNHPHICSVFDVGEDYLVMELLEGESLADRIARGPLPLPEVLRYGAQIAEALDRAHGAGVVHRDLKPSNVVITRAGAKLLDFGLAKHQIPVATEGDAATVQKPLTQEGTILGTFQYMAPEQLEGLPADSRSDIFALGVLLYEMATGQRAFEGKTRTSLIAAIVKETPRSMVELQPMTPPAFEHVTMKCLEKDPEERWQSARDIANELRWIANAGQPGASLQPAARFRARETLAWILFLLAATAALVIGYRSRQSDESRQVLRLTIPLPPDTIVDQNGQPLLAISRDGSRIVYSAVDRGIPRLWIRRLDRFEVTPLPGTEGALSPFFSPDGHWIGFASNGMLRKISITGGTVTALAPAQNFRGGTWSVDGNIYFAPYAASPIFRIPATGGTPVAVTSLDTDRGENSHRWPEILPDGKHLLITAKMPQIASFDQARVVLVSLPDGGMQTLLEGGTHARFLPPGHLVFLQGETLMRLAFDPKTRRTSGNPVPLIEGVFMNETTGGAYYAIAENGSIAYVPQGPRATLPLLSIDRNGTVMETPVSRELRQLRVSPDGRFVATQLLAANDDIAIYDIERRTLTRLSFEPGNESWPVWSADGKSIFYAAEKLKGDGMRILRRAADGSGPAEEIMQSTTTLAPTSVSPDGKLLAYASPTAETGLDIWMFSLEERKATLFIQTPYNERAAMFSPDGKWIAYQSNESGRDEVYVRSLEPGGGRFQVSTEGGLTPRWSRDGRELFYWYANSFYGVKVGGRSGFSLEPPVKIVATEPRTEWDMTGITQYDVTEDGRFLLTKATASLPMTSLNFIANLRPELDEGAAQR